MEEMDKRKRKYRLVKYTCDCGKSKTIDRRRRKINNPLRHMHYSVERLDGTFDKFSFWV